MRMVEVEEGSARGGGGGPRRGENGGLRIEHERKNAGLRSDLGKLKREIKIPGCIWTRLAGLWPAANPGAPRQVKNAGFRSELKWLGRVAAWKCGAPERARGARVNKPAVGSEISKIVISGTAKTVKWWSSWAEYFKICENDMLPIGNSGLKMGSLARHIPSMHTYGSTPPPPG